MADKGGDFSAGRFFVSATVHSDRRNLFSMVPGDEHHIATLVSGSKSKIQRFDDDCEKIVRGLAFAADFEKALRDMRAAYGRLHDFLSDAIEGGRLKEGDIPDDYAAIVAQLEGPCSAADDAAKKIIAEIDAL